jgi:pteridine reductase
MDEKPLLGKTVMVTGAARRIGRHLALSVASAGADVVIHYSKFPKEAKELEAEVIALGRRAWIIHQDFNELTKLETFTKKAFSLSHVDYLINNSAIFEHMGVRTTTLDAWQRHMNIDLTAPFFLSQAFAEQIGKEESGRIVNILDWRALRPGKDHLPYTISKAALASVTEAMAVALAPNIQVNGVAFGAILPPEDGSIPEKLLDLVPMHRLGTLDEVSQTVLFLLTGPAYITGEIIHLDGGRHLV